MRKVVIRGALFASPSSGCIFLSSMSSNEILTVARDTEKLDQDEDPYFDDCTGPDHTEAALAETFEDTQEERNLVRKLDRRILPITCLLYLFACSPFPCVQTKGSALNQKHSLDLDRSNIGNARLQGLPEDTLGGDKTGVLFDWLVSAFFFSYVGITSMTF